MVLLPAFGESSKMGFLYQDSKKHKEINISFSWIKDCSDAMKLCL